MKIILLTLYCFFMVSCSGVRKKDLEAWRGAPIEDLLSHTFFASIPMEKRDIGNGKILYIFTNSSQYTVPQSCTTNYNSLLKTYDTQCTGGGMGVVSCSNQFIVKDNQVLEYRPVGRCKTDCSVRPASRPCN